jgi:hypothetical protein
MTQSHIHEAHSLSKKLSADALDRFSSTGDPYGSLIADGNFRAALLKSLDGNMIISGAVLQEVQKLNGGNGNGRGLRGKAKAYALPVIGGGGIGTLLLIKAVEFTSVLV